MSGAVNATVLFDALAALKTVLEIEHTGQCVIPTPAYMAVLRAHSALRASLLEAGIKVEVAQ